MNTPDQKTLTTNLAMKIRIGETSTNCLATRIRTAATSIKDNAMKIRYKKTIACVLSVDLNSKKDLKGYNSFLI